MPPHFLEGLVDGHGADGDGALRRIHSRVAWMFLPVDRSMTVSAPQLVAQTHLFDFFLDAGGDGGVADVGVDLDEEVAADDHRLEFGDG